MTFLPCHIAHLNVKFNHYDISQTNCAVIYQTPRQPPPQDPRPFILSLDWGSNQRTNLIDAPFYFPIENERDEECLDVGLGDIELSSNGGDLDAGVSATWTTRVNRLSRACMCIRFANARVLFRCATIQLPHMGVLRTKRRHIQLKHARVRAWTQGRKDVRMHTRSRLTV